MLIALAEVAEVEDEVEEASRNPRMAALRKTPPLQGEP